MICAYGDAGERGPVALALRWWATLHPSLDVRREVLLCSPSTGARPIKRARYRCTEFLYEPLEVYMDLWNGTGPA